MKPTMSRGSYLHRRGLRHKLRKKEKIGEKCTWKQRIRKTIKYTIICFVITSTHSIFQLIRFILMTIICRINWLIRKNCLINIIPAHKTRLEEIIGCEDLLILNGSCVNSLRSANEKYFQNIQKMIYYHSYFPWSCASSIDSISTRLAVRSHYFTAEICRYNRKFYCKIFFSRNSSRWYSLLGTCFTLNGAHQKFECNVSHHLLSPWIMFFYCPRCMYYISITKILGND